MPLVSVIVPAYDADKHITHCISSLLHQQTTFSHETIIVDDASTDKTPRFLQEISASTQIRAILKPKRDGSYACRNLGTHIAKGNILVFTEPDCIPASDWLQKIASPIIHGKASAVQGITKSMSSGVWVELEKARISLYRGVNTKNFAIKKQAFEELGGFDESFLVSNDVSSGDADLYHRMLNAGIQIHHQHDAVVFHHWPNNPFKFLGKSKMYSLGRVMFLLKHNPKSVNWMKKRNMIRYIAGRALAGAQESFSKTRKRIVLPPSLKPIFFFYYFIFFMCTSYFMSIYAKNPILRQKNQKDLLKL